MGLFFEWAGVAVEDPELVAALEGIEGEGSDGVTGGPEAGDGAGAGGEGSAVGGDQEERGGRVG